MALHLYGLMVCWAGRGAWPPSQMPRTLYSEKHTTATTHLYSEDSVLYSIH